MRLRLRQRLEGYLSTNRGTAESVHESTGLEPGSLQNRYQLTREDVDTRARAALRHLERSEIGTIHSFAATLLRLYPLEAALDPQFREDEGNYFKKHFDSALDAVAR